MTRKIKVLILVQSISETGYEFAERITKACNSLENDKGVIGYYAPKISFTCSSDGRQTANIVYSYRA